MPSSAGRLSSSAGPLSSSAGPLSSSASRLSSSARPPYSSANINCLAPRLNAFFYGNSNFKSPELPRVFPLLVSKHDKTVSFEHCRFKIEKQFQSTARQSLWRMLHSANIFTLEASFHGYADATSVVHEFTPQLYRSIGKNVCLSLFKVVLEENQKLCQQMPTSRNIYSQLSNRRFTAGRGSSLAPTFSQLKAKKTPAPANNENVDRTAQPQAQKACQSTGPKGAPKFYVDEQLSTTSQAMVKQIMDDLKNNQKLIDIGEQEDSGSDSAPSGDELEVHILNKLMPKPGRQKKRAKRGPAEAQGKAQSQKGAAGQPAPKRLPSEKERAQSQQQQQPQWAGPGNNYNLINEQILRLVQQQQSQQLQPLGGVPNPRPPAGEELVSLQNRRLLSKSIQANNLLSGEEGACCAGPNGCAASAQNGLVGKKGNTMGMPKPAKCCDQETQTDFKFYQNDVNTFVLKSAKIKNDRSSSFIQSSAFEKESPRFDIYRFLKLNADDANKAEGASSQNCVKCFEVIENNEEKVKKKYFLLQGKKLQEYDKGAHKSFRTVSTQTVLARKASPAPEHKKKSLQVQNVLANQPFLISNKRKQSAIPQMGDQPNPFADCGQKTHQTNAATGAQPAPSNQSILAKDFIFQVSAKARDKDPENARYARPHDTRHTPHSARCTARHTVLHATHSAHCRTCHSVLHATHCTARHTVPHATLYCMQHCTARRTVLHATHCAVLRGRPALTASGHAAPQKEELPGHAEEEALQLPEDAGAALPERALGRPAARPAAPDQRRGVLPAGAGAVPEAAAVCAGAAKSPLGQ